MRELKLTNVGRQHLGHRKARVLNGRPMGTYNGMCLAIDVPDGTQHQSVYLTPAEALKLASWLIDTARAKLDQ